MYCMAADSEAVATVTPPAVSMQVKELEREVRELPDREDQVAELLVARCEALLAAHEATGELHFLHRAETVAHNITQRQAALADGNVPVKMNSSGKLH